MTGYCKGCGGTHCVCVELEKQSASSGSLIEKIEALKWPENCTNREALAYSIARQDAIEIIRQHSAPKQEAGDAVERVSAALFPYTPDIDAAKAAIAAMGDASARKDEVSSDAAFVTSPATDHEGRPITYWGGLATEKQSEISVDAATNLFDAIWNSTKYWRLLSQGKHYEAIEAAVSAIDPLIATRKPVVVDLDALQDVYDVAYSDAPDFPIIKHRQIIALKAVLDAAGATYAK
jgi:hypothetical protein